MRKTNIGSMEIIETNMVQSYFEEYRVVIDGKECLIVGFGGDPIKAITIANKTSGNLHDYKETGRARKIYNKLRNLCANG